MEAIAPAKAILSGEHAVVYGAPALAVAVRRYARCRIAPARGFRLRLPDLGLERRLTHDDLLTLHRRSGERYRDFQQGRIPVDRILAGEGDLLLFALVELLGADRLAGLPGLAIEIDSEIPVGAGMGSSAATVAALLTALVGQLELPTTAEALLRSTRNAEQLQHGRSSGIDPAICCRGGGVRFQQGAIRPLALAWGPGWYLADTGRPEASTGVCCERVRQGFADSAIWSEFADLSDRLAGALQQEAGDEVGRLIRLNHRLLCRIGVVPEPVQAWIAALEADGAAAKISGAGSVSGDRAGLVLVYHPDPPAHLTTGVFPLTPMEIDNHGARLRD